MAAGKNTNNTLAFILWLLLLSCLLIPAAVIVNFSLGDSQFQAELAEYQANN
jgi:ABC-type spermidine/putrescine transport system permease subunit II